MTDKPIYYRVISGPVKTWCMDWRKRRGEAGDLITAWAKAQGATAWVPDSAGGVGGLIFDRKPDADWVEHRRKSADGYTMHTPRKRSPLGKARQVEMSALGKLPPATDICEAFSIPTAVDLGRADGAKGVSCLIGPFFNRLDIGWVGDEFWIVMPDINAAIAERASNGWTVTPASWTAPAGMELLTRAHYDLAQAQRAVAELEKAA